jgi:hypothetical protein
VIAWKVVSRRVAKNVFVSLAACGEYRVEYFPGKTTVALPDTIGLFCFKDAETARAYTERTFGAHVLSSFALWECDVTPTVSAARSMATSCRSQDLDEYYAKHGVVYDRALPTGTILCSSVTLLKEIPL